MILMYHQLSEKSTGRWQVSQASFQAQISAIKQNHMNVVRLSDYNPGNKNDVVITFDDAYESVYEIAFPILKQFDFKFELFCVGNYIGGYNWFDHNEPLVRLADLDQLIEMAAWGAGVQWHTFNHPRLPDLNMSELEYELTVPPKISRIFPDGNFNWFCYPYGLRTSREISIARSKFKGAVAVYDCSPKDLHDLSRKEVNDDWRFPNIKWKPFIFR